MESIQSRIGRQKLYQQSKIQQSATKRLMRDWKQVQQEPLVGIAAAPLEKNLFVWHANIKGPQGTFWEGGIFHLVMNFNSNYPEEPPTVTLCTRIEHPCVSGSSVCLDLLEKRSRGGNGSWNPSYTVQSILIQLQAFLFEADPSKIFSEITEPKQYEQKKKEWISGVKWSVEQSLNYQDKSVGHFPPRKPWPAFATEETSQKVTADFSKLTFKDVVRAELLCFHSRQTFEEDVLGVGVTFSKNLRTGEIKSINVPDLDFISLRSFMNQNLRTNAAGTSFTHFLPVFIEPKHGQKAMHLAKRALSIIATGSSKNFQPEQAFLFPKCMAQMIVDLMAGKKNASIKLLRGYCLFYRMFWEFCVEYPQLRQKAKEIVEGFLNKEENRHKDVNPNLGELLSLMSVTDISFDQIKKVYVEESMTRNVFWLLQKYPELENTDGTTKLEKEFTDDDRLQYSFDATRVSQRFTMFYQWFLTHIANNSKNETKEQIMKQFDAYFGRVEPKLEDEFLEYVEQVHRVTNFTELFQQLQMPMEKSQILELLKQSIRQSKAKGYHGTQLKVLTPEEYAKTIGAAALDLSSMKNENGELIADEAKWKSLCNARFAQDELPDYLSNSKTENPWRNLYMQLHLQELITRLNDNPDFVVFHSVLDLCSEVKQLEITMFIPSQIKSKFFFLTAILSKLKSLETLIIKKGDCGLGIKGFKALVKGLSQNPGNLKQLNLQFCDLDKNAVEELTKGKLVSSNLEVLNLRGNPLADAGAQALATFLLQHQNLPHLRLLDLSDCQIGATGARAIAETLLVKRELLELRMQNNPFGNAMPQLLNNLAYSTSIKHVNFGKVRGQFDSSDNQGKDSLGKLLRLSQSVSSLNFWRVTSFANVHADVLRQALSENKSLTDIDLSETNFNKLAALGESFAKNSSVKKLMLDKNGITIAHLIEMYDNLKNAHHQLQIANATVHTTASVKVSDNDDVRSVSSTSTTDTKKKGKKAAAHQQQQQQFTDPIIHLETLHLSNNDMSYAPKPKQHRVIGDLLLFCKSLTVLDLSYCRLHGQHMEAIGTALLPKHGLILRELNLQKNNLEETGLKPFLSGMQENTSVKVLNLSGNGLNVRGGKFVAQILEKNIGLQKLNLFGNFVEIEGAIAIAASLQVNKTLKELDLGLNRIRARGADAVAAMLRVNSSLQKLGLKLNHLNDKVALQIATAIVSENANSQIQAISMGGNNLSVPIQAQLAAQFAKKNITFDLSKLVEVRDADRQSKTVYVSGIPDNTTLAQVKKYFQNDQKCGAVVGVCMYKHKNKTPKTRRAPFFAFVEFAHQDSVTAAVRLMATKKNRMRGNELHISLCGVQQNKGEQPQAQTNTARGGAALRGGRPSAVRGVRGRGAGRGRR